jgi:hypothetical protein
VQAVEGKGGGVEGHRTWICAPRGGRVNGKPERGGLSGWPEEARNKATGPGRKPETRRLGRAEGQKQGGRWTEVSEAGGTCCPRSRKGRSSGRRTKTEYISTSRSIRNSMYPDRPGRYNEAAAKLSRTWI